MLEFLRIRNLALIEDMELDFVAGMNVLTGETGAGKSFILKALGFLLGDRMSSDMIRTGAEKAQVEALFTLDNNEILLRRELMAETGRSRLYLNDTLSSQENLRELRQRLISHTSQHAQHLLLQPSFQAKLLDDIFPAQELLVQRDTLLIKLSELEKQRCDLEKRRTDLLEKRDLLEMQQAEIDKVAPQKGEEEHLEGLRIQARSNKRLCENYETAFALLHGENGIGLLELLGRFERLMHEISLDDDALASGAESVTMLHGQLVHLGNMLRRPPLPELEMDMDAVESRLFALSQLKRKLHRDLPEILILREEIEKNLSFLDACALDISHLVKEKEALTAELQQVMTKIIPVRRYIAQDLARKLEAELRDLGFSDQVRIIPQLQKLEIWPGVFDEKMRILWAPNPGQPPQPLDKIASGGELSRFLLALASLRQDSECTTFIFDEVDAGIGGLTLSMLAEKLTRLANKRQVLLITHWPQLAARAHKHFQVRKIISEGETFTLCSPLDENARHAELARMGGGGAQGEALAQSLVKSLS